MSQSLELEPLTGNIWVPDGRNISTGPGNFSNRHLTYPQEFTQAMQELAYGLQIHFKDGWEIAAVLGSPPDIALIYTHPLHDKLTANRPDHFLKPETESVRISPFDGSLVLPGSLVNPLLKETNFERQKSSADYNQVRIKGKPRYWPFKNTPDEKFFQNGVVFVHLGLESIDEIIARKESTLEERNEVLKEIQRQILELQYSLNNHQTVRVTNPARLF